MTDSFKKIATNWEEAYTLTQDYLAHVESQTQQTVRIYGYGSLIFNHKNEKNGSELQNESAILQGSKVAPNVMAAGDAEYRGEYNQHTDERARRSVGVYMGMEQGGEKDFSQGINVTLELERAQKSLTDLYIRELGPLPEGITPDDLFKKNNHAKFENIPDGQNNFKLYKLAIVENAINIDGEEQKVPALAVLTNEKSALSAVGKSAMEIAVMVAQGQGIQRKSGESTLGGDDIDYFLNTHKKYTDHDIKVPFMDEVKEALEKYLSFCKDMNTAIKSGDFNTDKLAEIYEKNGMEKYSRMIEDKSLPNGGYPNSGISSPFFNDSIKDALTKRTDYTEAEYIEGLKKIPHTAKLSIERLADLHDKHFGKRELS